MKYENYGLIKESWDKFVVSEQSSRALLESLTDKQINEMFYAIIMENDGKPFSHIRKPRGAAEKTGDAIGKLYNRLKSKVLRGAGLVALVDIMIDLPQTGPDIDALTNSPAGVAILTVALMNQFKISKEQAVKAAQAAAQTAKDKGPDAARQAAAATADAARVAGKKTVEYTERVANDSRASPAMKSLFRNLSVILSPEEMENPEEVMSNEPELRRRVKQITDKTAGPVKPRQQKDDGIIDAEFEEEPT